MSKKRLLQRRGPRDRARGGVGARAVTASAKPAKQQRHGQARLHHEVPGRLLLHPRRRREDVGQGDAGRAGHLRQRQERHRRRRRDRGDPEHGRPGREGHRDHPDEPGRVRGARQGDQAGRQGRPDGQRHPDVEEASRSVVATNNFNGGVLAGQVPRHEAEGRRHARRSSRASPASRRSTTASPACSRGSAR